MATDPLYNKPIPKLPLWAGNNSMPIGTGWKAFDGEDRPWVGDLGPAYQAGSTMPPAGQAPVSTNIIPPYQPSSGSGFSWGQIASGVAKIAPFASNIVNSFRKPPAPKPPSGYLSPVTLSRVDDSNERAQIDRQVRGEDRFADTNLDGNTAAAYRQANLAGKLRAYGDSFSKENTTNVGISNQQAQMNSNIQERNLGKMDDYNDKVTSMQIAQQRASSENIANASDKYVALQNAQAQRDLDTEKWSYASRLFGPGLADRLDQYRSDPVAYQKKLQEQEAISKASGTKLALGGKLNSNSPLSMKKLRKVY